MIPQAKTLTLRDGREAVLKSPEVSDAASMLDFLKKTAGESNNLLRRPHEVTLSLMEEADFLRQLLDDPRRCMLNAVVGEDLAGNVSVYPVGTRERVRHRAGVGIAVRQQYWGQGLGKRLMQAATEQARELGYEQLELTVYADNARGLALYKALGFETWGHTKNACKMDDGSYRDDVYMGLFL